MRLLYFIPLMAALSWSLSGCGPAPGPRPGGATSASVTPTGTPSATPKENLFSTAGKTLIQSKKGRQWMMEVLKVIWNDDKRKARVENVDWTLTDNHGKKQLRVQAPAAVYFPEDNRIVFEGRVTASRYFAKDRIFVNHLIWEGKKGQFLGSQGVRWERGTVVVTGDNMNCPDSLERIHLEGNVKGKGLIEDGMP